jgi:hypothetical protein
MNIDAGVEMGLAHGFNKPIVLASCVGHVLESLPLAYHVSWKKCINYTASRAFSETIADIDITLLRGFERVWAHDDGKCTLCQGSYSVEQQIYWARNRGAYHVDCYLKAHDPAGHKSLCLETELVPLLREENARLEKECAELMVQNSMLRSQLAK